MTRTRVRVTSSATLSVTHTVSAQALVCFRGNRQRGEVAAPQREVAQKEAAAEKARAKASAGEARERAEQ